MVAMPLAHIRLAGVIMTEEELNVQVQAAQDEIARLRETFGPAYAKLGEALYPGRRVKPSSLAVLPMSLPR